jgi:hypothetical protein
MLCAILALSNIHIEILIGKVIIRINYITLYEIICCYMAKNYEKLKQLV